MLVSFFRIMQQKGLALLCSLSLNRLSLLPLLHLCHNSFPKGKDRGIICSFLERKAAETDIFNRDMVIKEGVNCSPQMHTGLKPRTILVFFLMDGMVL